MNMLSTEGSKISNELNIARSCSIESRQFALDGGAIEEDFKSYKEALESTISDNLYLVDQLPPLKYLGKEEVKKYLHGKLEEQLKKDGNFEKTVEISKYVKSINKYLQVYYREIFNHQAICKQNLGNEIVDICRMYFNSDMPLRFLKALENSILAQIDFLDIYDKRLRHEQFSMLRNRANRKRFHRLVEEHNNWVKPFNELLDEIGETRIKLFWYVDIGNSKTVNEMFQVKKIEAASLDMKVVEDYLEHLEAITKDAKLIVDEKMTFQPIEKYDAENGSRTIREVMDLLPTLEE